jgi:hypothetical protein
MGLGSGIRDPGSGKNLFGIPDPGSESATLNFTLYVVEVFMSGLDKIIMSIFGWQYFWIRSRPFLARSDSEHDL